MNCLIYKSTDLLKKVCPNLFYLFVSVFFYTPLLILYLGNTSGGFIFPALITPSIAAICSLLIPTLLNVKWPKWIDCLETFLIGPTIYVIIIVTFFPLQSGALDGRNSTIDTTTACIYFGFMLLCLAIPLLFRFKNGLKQHFQRATNILGLYAVLVAIFASISIMPVDNGLKTESHYTKIFSEKNNIIVVLLDMVQSDFVIEYFRLNAAAEETFDGFTFYRNTASFGASTSMSYSGLMTGEIPKGMNNVKSIDHQNNLLNDMINNGYKVKYHSVIPYSQTNDELVVIPEAIAIEQKNKYFSFVLLCSRRYLPFTFSLPFLSKEHGWMSKYDNQAFFKWLTQQLKIDYASTKSALWFHTTLTHTPVRFDKKGNFLFDLTPDNTMDELFYAFSLLTNFLNKVKELGIYDDSLLIVLSDHGYNTLGEMNNFPPGKEWYLTRLDPSISSSHPFVNLRIGQYSPFLLIKPPKAHGKLQYNNTAATLLDLRKTLNEFMLPGSGEKRFGINLLDKSNNSVDREVPIIRFAGKRFEPSDFQDTKKYVFDSLRLPFSKYYKDKEKNLGKQEDSNNRNTQNLNLYSTVIKDLNFIAKALKSYHNDYGAYPKSQGFDGLYTNWGSAKKDWIQGLAPLYLPNLPRDPRMNSKPDQQYLYMSDGHDFKLIAHVPPQLSEVQKLYPALVDPKRPNWAYGIWTDGAINW